MNLFNYFEAHSNPVEKVIQSLKKNCKGRNITAHLLFLLSRIIAFLLPYIFLIERGLGNLYVRIKRDESIKIPTKRKKNLSIIILNWNGEDILSECITHLDHALKRVPGDHEVIVVDNNSKDRSVELLRDTFPWVKVVRLKRNLGFARGNNRGIRVAKNDLIMLLNNDILLSEDTFTTLLKHFDDEKVFAVAPRVVLEDGRLNEGHSWGEFRDGMLYFYNERQSKALEMVKSPVITLYPIGACVIMDKKIYHSIGGLDPMFSPFYWEDDDLGYRALKMGYKVIYDPRVTVIHKNAASSSKLPKEYITVLKEKNMLLFLWKNLTYRPYLKEYLSTLRKRIEVLIKKEDYIHLLAYLLAFLQIGEVIKGRIKDSKKMVLTDKEVLALTRKERKSKTKQDLKPHVLLITPFPPYPLNNGGALRIYNLTKNLAKRFDFTLLSFVENKNAIRLPEEIACLFKSIHFVERKPTPFNELMKSELPQNYSQYLSLGMADTLKGIVSENGIDIVQIEFPWMAFYGRFVTNFPSIFVEHDVGAMFWKRSFMKPEGGIRQYLTPLKAINYENAFIDYFDRVITVTQKDEAILKALFPGIYVTTVETGVDLDLFPYSYKNNGEKNLIYLGSYRHYPNEDAVVYFVNEIFPLIKKEDRNIKLYIVGSHPTRRINRLKGREDIEITGTVDDVTHYLKKGTIFIAPIRLGGGIKGKILEAMSIGLPVVATPLAATGLGVRDGEDILIASTPDEFAEKVLTLLSNKDLREKISINGRRLVEERFDWRVLADKMARVYEEMV